MSAVPDTAAIDLPEWGPKLAALSEKRRAFVLALFDADAPRKGQGLMLYAARKAGYGTPTSSNKSLGVMAQQVAQSPEVQAAVREYGRVALRSGYTPEALRALHDLLQDPKSRDHARAIAMVLDRTDPLETTATIKIEDNRPASPEITQKVLDRIDALARRAGLLPPPKIIDVTPQAAE
jgi:hypothetical protein